jgi:hypothetical protein
MGALGGLGRVGPMERVARSGCGGQRRRSADGRGRGCRLKPAAEFAASLDGRGRLSSSSSSSNSRAV